VSFFQSHILNALTYKSYVCISTPWFGLVLFCFLKSNRVIRKVTLSLGLLYPLFQWYMGAEMLSGSLQNSFYTHIYMLYTQTGHDFKDNFIPPRKYVGPNANAVRKGLKSLWWLILSFPTYLRCLLHTCLPVILCAKELAP
jgi:hypothetical protein